MVNTVLGLPVCAGATGLGLVLSFLAWRRRGATAGIRGVAWSLLPMAAYLTGAHALIWGIVASVVGFVTGLVAGVINPFVWAGVGLAGLAVVLFVVSGVMRKRGVGGATPKQPKQAKVKSGVKTGETPAAQAATAPQAVNPSPAPSKGRAKDDDFSDIEEILKRRGIG
ncbi:cellulose synthase [Nonomuraea sp. NPDC050394]|uniref:cellulose synthase n=1 Tax=Nonomuraea sp. NPDC050394 TaxID=3364363 RepID=UPI0037B858CA